VWLGIQRTERTAATDATEPEPNMIYDRKQSVRSYMAEKKRILLDQRCGTGSPSKIACFPKRDLRFTER